MGAARIAWLVFVLWSWLPAVAAPSDDLSFERRRWTQADGAPAQTTGIAQTADGLLWFSSLTGLYSFDGVKFRRETEVFGHALVSSNTLSVLALPNNGLAVGYKFGGVSLFSQQGVQHFRPGTDFPLGSTKQIISDVQGNLYACTSTAIVALRGQKWQALGTRSFPKKTPSIIAIDRSGTLWAQLGTGLYAFDNATDQFSLVARINPSSTISTANGVLRVKLESGEFANIVRSGRVEVLPLGEPRRYASVVQGPASILLGARDGGLGKLVQDTSGRWLETEFYPPFHESVASASGNLPFLALLDREGNLWEARTEEVQRLRLQRFHHIKRQDWLWFVQRGMGDEMWMGGTHDTMQRLKPDGTVQATKLISPNVSLRVSPGQVWLGTESELWEFNPDSERRWPLPAQLQNQFGIQALAREADGTLLVSIVRNGLWRFDQGVWTQDKRAAHLKDATPISMLTDAAGRTWVGFTDSRLGLLTPDGMDLVSARLKLQIGNVLSMLDIGGRLLIGGDAGVAWVAQQGVQVMQFRRGQELQRVTGMVLDHAGRLWMHGDEGLHVLSAGGLEKFWHAPQTILETELFNFEDGVRGVASPTRPLPSLALDGEGRVYYATMLQVGWADPDTIRRNTRPPDVLIRSLATPDRQYRPVSGTVLPELTTAVDIGFTAPALSIPERVRMKYRLDGVDREWREIQQERAAHYTNLAPGKYRFQVIAANEDGVWNQQGAELVFTIAPAFWQTAWFRTVCVLLLALAAWRLYRWRVVIVKARALKYAEGQWHATLQERGRIARSLHDNLLQAVQALMMQFHLVQSKLTREPELQSKIEAVLDHAQQLVQETRDEVMGLRSVNLDDDWTGELRRMIAGMAPDIAQKLEFVVEGCAGRVTATRVEEIICVVREAVLNSAQHAQASQIQVHLQFNDDQVVGQVIDDGVGIDGALAGAGKTGHFGIVGMRERLQRMGGNLNIARRDKQGGTLVRFTIPASQAYRVL